MVREPKNGDIDAIRRQLEYYFSDSNLPRDKFLRAKTEENEDGFVKLSVLLTFNRLKNIGATEENMAKAICESEILGLDPDSSAVRRLTSLPPRNLFPERGIFAKGWKPGGPEPTLEELIEFFSPYGQVLSVRPRRWIDDEGKKNFKGSIFVEMESAEAVERVTAEEHHIDTQDDDGNLVRKELEVLAFEDYSSKKREEKRARAERRKSFPGRRRDKASDRADANGKSAANGDANGNVVNEENRAANKTETGALPKGGETAPHSLSKAEDKATPANDDNDAGHKKQESESYEKGLVVKFDNFGPDVSREDIREAFEPHGEIKWVDFQRGNSEGYLRFAESEQATAACSAMADEGTQFGGNVPKFTVLDGDEESLYWKHLREEQAARLENSKKRRRDGFRGGRGNKRFRGGGRGRGRGGRSRGGR